MRALGNPYARSPTDREVHVRGVIRHAHVVRVRGMIDDRSATDGRASVNAAHESDAPLNRPLFMDPGGPSGSIESTGSIDE